MLSLFALFFLFFSRFCHRRDLHSFPTRRSSDLALAALERRTDGGLLVGDHLDALAREAGLEELGLHHARHLFGTSTADVVVAAQDDLVERLAGDARDVADVLVAAVAGSGEHAHAAA